MATSRNARVQTRHPDPDKSGVRISRVKYDAVRAAILKAVPREGDGIPFKDLPDLVRRLLPRRVREDLGSVNWYTVTVKLDLEARRVLERVAGARPQRLRRRK
jgi:hypothetical protein